MRKHVEQRLRRLAGASPEALAKMQEARGSQMWWTRCWNCKRSVSMVYKDLQSATCPHCGVDLWHRS